MNGAGEQDIRALIPQREPILMVDRLTDADGDRATTCLTVRADNYFVGADGLMEEAGLVEHIAQSASAFAGLRAAGQGATAPPVGYIGEVKKFCCLRRPRVGETLLTTIEMGAEAGGVTLLAGETRAGGETIAATQLKIFVEPQTP